MTPFLSVVVISYNGQRELPRTLYSLSPLYQRDITADDYEVIVVDNGSATPPHAGEFESLGIDLRVLHYPHPTHSPVAAVNYGLNQSVGHYVCVYIDGARIASPGLLREALDALQQHPRAIVGSRGRYLGPELQRDSMTKGYNQRTEDVMLNGSGWRDNGYCLFDLSVWDESSANAWFGPVTESNSLFMPRQLWFELGGFDPAFSSPGGGLANLDTWARACGLPDVHVVLLVGEATFHQFHGGVATNGPNERIVGFFDEYKAIRNCNFAVPDVTLHFSGTFHSNPTAGASWATLPVAGYIRTSRRIAKVKRVVRVVGRRVPRRLRRPLSELARFGRFAATRNLTMWRNERSAAREIASSEYFDASWYRTTYPDVAAASYPPALHYLRFGLAQRRNPGPRFDGVWYLDHHVAEVMPDQNPLLHYERIGRAAGLAVKPVHEAASTPE